MALVFHANRDEDLIGVGVVNGNAASCHTAAVDIVGARSGVAVASGFAVYRLPG
jgi:hypothetical protein